jgi:hypothetical protein
VLFSSRALPLTLLIGVVAACGGSRRYCLKDGAGEHDLISDKYACRRDLY